MNQAKRKVLLVLSNSQQAQEATAPEAAVVSQPLPVALKELPAAQPASETKAAEVVASVQTEVTTPTVEEIVQIVEDQPVVAQEDTQESITKNLRNRKFKKDVEVGQ